MCPQINVGEDYFPGRFTTTKAAKTPVSPVKL